jgi:hypothetical protein
VVARLGVAAASLAALGACAATVPTPPLADHARDTPALVPYPPPPARVEAPPARPSDEALWVDGTWRWIDGGWHWRPGRWEHPRPGARYAPPLLIRRQSGELYYYEGSWSRPDADAERGAR